MKIDITALREAAKKFATTLDAHRANPRDALAVIEWDEATSALTDIVCGNENNIIVALFDMLEAEHQRADDLVREKENATYEWGEAQSNYDSAKSKIRSLEAELSALRGTQEPVDTGIFTLAELEQISKSRVRDMPENHADHHLAKLALQYFTHPTKPVVLPQRYTSASLAGQGITVKDTGGDLLDRLQVIAAIEAAGGIVVKDGE